MDCKAVRKAAFFYADQKLNDEEMTEIRQHCANCPSCEKEIAEALAFVEMLQDSVTYLEAPADFNKHVLQSIAALNISENGFGKVLENPKKAWFKRYGLSSVAIVAVCAMLLIPAINNAQLGEQLMPKQEELTVEKELPAKPETPIKQKNSLTTTPAIISQPAVEGKNTTEPAVVKPEPEKLVQNDAANPDQRTTNNNNNNTAVADNEKPSVEKPITDVEEAPPMVDLPVVKSTNGGLLQMASGADMEMLKTRIVTSVLPEDTQIKNNQSYDNVSPNGAVSLEYLEGKYALMADKTIPLSKKLTGEQKIAWSLDSKKLAFSSVDGFLVIDAANGNVHEISAYGGNEIAWSNSSKKVAFTDTENTLYVAVLSTSGNLLKVEKLAQGVMQLAWTADDNLQYLSLAEDGSSKLEQATWQ